MQKAERNRHGAHIHTYCTNYTYTAQAEDTVHPCPLPGLMRFDAHGLAARGEPFGGEKKAPINY